MNTILEIKNYSKAYGNGKKAADGVSLNVMSGDIYGFIGHNGAGKSTTIRAVVGVLDFSEGEILIDGENLNLLTASEKSRKISIVLTHNEDIRGMTVWDVVAMGRSPYTGYWGRLSDNDRQIVSESLAMAGICPTPTLPREGERSFLDRRITEISDGERQKVMIAKAIAQQTPVILLDEPTAFLDYPSKRRMFRLLTQVARDLNKAILLSTHDIDHAKRYGDVAWMMDKGQLRCSSFEELIAEKPDFFSSEEE
jgi:iron complex transport system ATP-binding protein